jgi:16S rRNA (cytidine1402-2'-O)-methyltransferase
MQNLFTKTKEIKIENALYIVASPIGNLQDISFRALNILQNVDVIICEDSRVSMRLLDFYEIKNKKLIIYNDFNSEEDRKKILHLLMQQKSLALISDAGTPLISDPGYKLIEFLRQFNQKIIPIPGACSPIAALCASGVASDSFLFIGFLPNSKTQRENLFKELPKNHTFICFEAPNRILETLQLIKDILQNRKICVARELTKLHEEIITSEADELINFFTTNQEKLRGEFVIIVEKAKKDEKSYSKEELILQIKAAIKAGESLKDLSKNIAEIYNINKKEIYQLALEISKN